VLNFISDKIKLFFCDKAEKEFFLFIQSQIGHAPNNLAVYKESLTHKSALVKKADGSLICNERLEYLGDSVIDTSVSKYLYERYPNENEGFLTKMRSKIVNRKSLNQIGTEIKLDKYIISGPMYNDSTNGVGNALEAFVGAIFLDKGYESADKFVLNVLLKHIDFNFLENVDTNYKSRLIEVIQHGHGTILFETVEELKDDVSERHSPTFISVITINDCRFCDGRGKTKKEAEQNASHAALQILKQNAEI